jgi:hypothetical protein
MAKRFADFFDTLSETMEKLRTQLELLSGYAKLYLHYSKVKEVEHNIIHSHRDSHLLTYLYLYRH